MPKKILIADDEKDIVELVAYNLEQEGFAVIRTYDGRQAWERVNSEKPDLLILDLMMPVLPGMEVCRMIRRQASTASLPIIMLTAKSDPIDKILGLEVGADDYIACGVRNRLRRVRFRNPSPSEDSRSTAAPAVSRSTADRRR
jgi:DNA-binding response OmpR family regulator